MRLYFLRHGIADWPQWDMDRDHERPLNDEGVKKMKAEARAIAQLDLGLNVILSSPYTRAWQTADIVAEHLMLELREEPLLAPGFNLDRLREILSRHADKNVLMLVGHEPGFSLTIGELIGGGRIEMKKGGLARVDLDSIEALQGQLVWLLTSKVLT